MSDASVKKKGCAMWAQVAVLRQGAYGKVASADMTFPMYYAEAVFNRMDKNKDGWPPKGLDPDLKGDIFFVVQHNGAFAVSRYAST